MESGRRLIEPSYFETIISSKCGDDRFRPTMTELFTTRTATAERVRRHRRRRRRGVRFMLPLPILDYEIDRLVEYGLLDTKDRDDVNAVVSALRKGLAGTLFLV